MIVVHVPHRGRVSPCQDDTLHDLEAVLNRVSQGDCICIIGDFNEQIQGNVKDRMDKWVGGTPSQNSEKIMQLLRLHELTAVNTLYAPRHGKEVHNLKRQIDAAEEARDVVGRAWDTVAAQRRSSFSFTASHIPASTSGAV